LIFYQDNNVIDGVILFCEAATSLVVTAASAAAGSASLVQLVKAAKLKPY
jgi:hypothetical protein